MDLWIRSQNKEMLIKIKNIEIKFLDFKRYSYVKDIKSKGEYSIRGNGEPLGQYKTKERALEVLDEIQRQLINKYYLIPKEKLTLKEQDELMSYGHFNPKIDIVSTLSKMELKPLNNNVYIYEMPNE